MTISTVASYTPVGGRPQAFAIGSTQTALIVDNQTANRLELLIGLALLVNVGPNSYSLIPGLSGQTSLVVAPDGLVATPDQHNLSGLLTITSYASGDALPPGALTQSLTMTPISQQTHYALERLRGGVWVNVRDFGARGDGVMDDTAPIQSAINVANVIGGAVVYIPAGTYLCTTITLASYARIRGDGIGSTVLMLKNGTNADLLQAFPANIAVPPTFPAFQSGPSQAINSFELSDMTIDGNQQGQSSGPCYPIRMYAYGYELKHLEVRNGWSGGILCDYSGPYPSSGNPNANNTTNTHRLEATWTDVKVHTNTGGSSTAIGISFYGPHDSRWTNVLSYVNNSHSIHVTGNNAGGLQATGCHAWQPSMADANSVCWLQEGSLYASGCEAEGSPYGQLAVLANGIVWNGGSIYGAATGAIGWGVQIGQAAGLTPYTNSHWQSAGLTTAVFCSSYVFNTLLQNIVHANGALWLAQDSGGVFIARCIAINATDTITTGTPATKSMHILNAQGYNDPWQQRMYMSGPVSVGQTASAQAIGNGGTINTSGIGQARVNPAGAVTGIILQSGTYQGQTLYVTNESGNTLTFAAAGTSHVADGVGDVIAGVTTRGFVWDSGTALWYRMG